MAHFAQLDENNIVVCVNVVNNNVLDPLDEETSGISFLNNWCGEVRNWVQVSYNGNKYNKFPKVGDFFNNNAFIGPSPYPSWVLDENYNWQPPVPLPEDGVYEWDEVSVSWVEASFDAGEEHENNIEASH